MRDDWLEPLGFEDTPDTVKGISADLRAVEPMLQNLKNTLQDDSSQIIPCDQIKHAVENCDRACVAFQSRIEHWMKHSTEDKIFWVDRWKIGLFGQERIKTAQRLQGYSQRSTVYFNHYYHVTSREPDERNEGYDASAE